MGTTTSEILGRFASGDESACYLFSKTTLQNNLSSILSAFKSIYPGVLLAYSFKTNYLKAICDTIRTEGHYAEVVSPAEYDYAMSLGFESDRIVYNGVIPDAQEKFRVAARGGYVNVDNLDEYMEITHFAETNRCKIRIGVRVNFDCGNGIVSRFGVDVDSAEFKILMNRISHHPLVTLAGFHTHIGSSRQVQYWERKAERMIALAKEYGVSYIDLGGGMFGKMPKELADQFSGYVGDFREYAEAVAGKMAKAFPRGEVALILEPGTALVGNTMKVAAKVTNIKSCQGRTYITVGCCSNHIGMLCECRDIPAATFFNFALNGNRINVLDATICGNTCLEFDYIKKGFNCSVLPGDLIVFDNCGAYSISASRQFIVPRLPVYDAETGEQLLRGESSLDMLGKYIIC